MEQIVQAALQGADQHRRARVRAGVLDDADKGEEPGEVDRDLDLEETPVFCWCVLFYVAKGRCPNPKLIANTKILTG